MVPTTSPVGQGASSRVVDAQGPDVFAAGPTEDPNSQKFQLSSYLQVFLGRRGFHGSCEACEAKGEESAERTRMVIHLHGRRTGYLEVSGYLMLLVPSLHTSR